MQAGLGAGIEPYGAMGTGRNLRHLRPNDGTPQRKNTPKEPPPPGRSTAHSKGSRPTASSPPASPSKPRAVLPTLASPKKKAEDLTGAV